MVSTTCSASVLFSSAIASKVSPASALHALDWFMFLLGGSDMCAADIQAIPYQKVGSLCR